MERPDRHRAPVQIGQLAREQLDRPVQPLALAEPVQQMGHDPLAVAARPVRVVGVHQDALPPALVLQVGRHDVHVDHVHRPQQGEDARERIGRDAAPVRRQHDQIVAGEVVLGRIERPEQLLERTVPVDEGDVEDARPPRRAQRRPELVRDAARRPE